MKNKIAICAIAKNENLYIRDWVEYHKNLCIDKIFLYDNNDNNGEHFESVIKDYIDSNFVEVINKRGIEKGLVYDKNNINLQSQCYIETYNNLKNNSDFKWIFFIDIDEYINIKEGTIKDYLNNKKFNNYDTIVFPWVIYDDNNKLKYENASLKNRFTHISYHKQADFPKCCIRIGKNIKDYTQYLLIHFIILEGEKICYETGEQVNWIYSKADINNNNKFINIKKILFPLDKINKCNITINHYKFKTLEEYLIRQYKRHWGSTKQFTKKPKTLKALAGIFFKYNEKTPEKEQIINNLKSIVQKGQIIVNLYYKNNKQIINLLNQLNKQVFKPTDILIHITEEQFKNNKLNLKNFKNFKISYYHKINKPNYPDNKLIKINDLKYKITLNDKTKYDDQFLKTLVIKSLFN